MRETVTKNKTPYSLEGGREGERGRERERERERERVIGF